MEISAVLLIAFVVLFVGISKSAFAGAFGVFGVPLLMFKFSAIQAIALMLPLLIIADLLSVRSFWKKWDTKLLASLIPGAMIGILVAHLTIDFINADHLGLMIAIICIVFAVKNIWFKQTRLRFIDNRLGAYIMSTIAGITSTLVHAGGPPMIMYFITIKLSPTKFVATAAILFAIMNVFKLIGFVSLGLLTFDTLLTAVAFLPLAFIGNWLGLRINQVIEKQLFLKVMNYLLLILGVWLVSK